MEERMKKFGIALVMSLGILAIMAAPAMAFHDEGVARCSGCHTMHNSENGVPNVGSTGQAPGGNPYLLKYGTASDMCLSCHATGHGAQWGTDMMNPPPEKGAGNFCFLGEDNINDGRNGQQPANWMPGYKAGHSIVALTKNAVADPTLLTAPGGTYPSSAMGCTSCHDPHGRETFRLLYGAGPVEAGHATFTHEAPIADGMSIEDASAESPTNHTAYHSGMSAWCANCHGQFHNDGATRHPSGRAIGGSIAQAYDLYNGTGATTPGTHATAYIPQVPFEDVTTAVSSSAGPTSNSEVSCVTCHRAHATSAPNAGRWDFNLTWVSQDGATSGSYAIPQPYGYNQRSLCNKCHNKDEHDGPRPQ
jgi:hypothetical protein